MILSDTDDIPLVRFKLMRGNVFYAGAVLDAVTYGRRLAFFAKEWYDT